MRAVLLQNLHNEYPYHVDTLLQLGEILKMGDDRQAAAEMIGTEQETNDDDSAIVPEYVFTFLKNLQKRVDFLRFFEVTFKKRNHVIQVSES